ncbi:MAG: hypothetical protein ACC628_15730 [Pirellulaceae bacterium]
MTSSVDASTAGPAPDSLYDSNEIPVLICLPDMRQRTSVAANSIATPPRVEPPGDERVVDNGENPRDRTRSTREERGPGSGKSRISKWNTLPSKVIVGGFLIAVTGIVYALVQGPPGTGEVEETATGSPLRDAAPEISESAIDRAPWASSSNEVDLWPEGNTAAAELIGNRASSPPSLAGAIGRPAATDETSGPAKSWPPMARSPTDPPRVSDGARSPSRRPPNHAVPARPQADPDVSRPRQSVPVFSWNRDESLSEAGERPFGKTVEAGPNQASDTERVQQWPPAFASGSSSMLGPPSNLTQGMAPPTYAYPDTSSSFLSNGPSNDPRTAPPVRTGMRNFRTPGTPQGGNNSGGARLDGNVVIPQPRAVYERSRPSLY